MLANDTGVATPQADLPVMNSGYQWNGDGWENPNSLMIGGHGAWQGGALRVLGAPYSYGDVGCVVDVEMTNLPWSASRCGSGDMDGVAQFINAGNTTPYYKVGADFTDDTGTTHTLTFDANGVTVKPALPASFTAMWAAHGAGGGSGMWVVTNLLANASTAGATVTGFPAQMSSDKWEGYVTSVTAATGGTHLDMPAGWHPESGWVGVSGTNNGSVPDASVGLDQVFYSDYKNPLLVIGTFNQAFSQNMKCGLDFSKSGSSSTTIMRSDAPVNSCQGNELDFYVPATMPNGFMHAQGFTADLLNSLPLVAPNSAAFVAQGNWPTAFQTGLGADGRDFFGGVLDVNSRRGPAATVGAMTEIMEAMQGADAPTDVRSNMQGLRVTQVTDTVGYTNSAGAHNPADNSIHLGMYGGGSQFGVNSSDASDLGTYKGDFVFNPGWLKGGLALCGSVNGGTNSSGSCVGILAGGQITVNPNQTSSGVGLNVDPAGYSGGSGGSAAIAVGAVPSTSATVIGAYLASTYGNDLEELYVGTVAERMLDAKGNETLNGNLTVGSGSSVMLTPSGGPKVALYSNAAGTQVGLSNFQSVVDLHADSITTGTITYASQGTGAFDGEQRYCSDCKLNGITGVPVWWHASAAKWTDSQNNALAN
ncbi:hypothetical protein GMO_21210 [Gluconobacter morbifer G707]|uniref:Uncharacterized protein n=1 Tax=Gluconobacter morbifer G707 TaxID=1088869 RepID=G6XKV5_9PROT|nr:hypothetical protein GMO_21210 [Gluconobacter morbifer G707]